MSGRPGFAGAVFLLSLSAWQSPASAQSFWNPQDAEDSFMLEYLSPSIEDESLPATSAAYFATLRLGLSTHFTAVGEASYALSQAGDHFNSTIGNPYLGLEARPSHGPVSGELGVHFASIDEGQASAREIGLASDVKRWEAFLPRAVFIQGAFNLREVTASKVEYRLRISPVLLLPHQDRSYIPRYPDGAELFATYAWMVGYHSRKVRIGTGLSGRILLTDSSGNLGERSLNQFELHADFGSSVVRPGFDLHLPLDSWSDSVPVVVGASLSFSH